MGQKDPLSEFKKEAFALFEGLVKKIKNDVIKFLMNLNVVISDDQNKKKTDKDEKNTNIASENKGKKIEENEKCPCG